MISEVEKYLDKHRVTDDLKHLYTGSYTNATAAGLASLDGSIQAYKNDVYINGNIIVEFVE